MSTESAGQRPIQILVADGTHIHTQLLAGALQSDSELHALVNACDLNAVLETARHRDFDVALIGPCYDEDPHRDFELLRQLRSNHPAIRVIVLLDSERPELVLEAFRAGARGIFNRKNSLETLRRCIHAVYQGQIWANSEEMALAVEALASTPTIQATDSQGLDLLSKREMEVVQCLAEGLSNREIAERLGLSPHTIKNYLFRIFDKLGVSSRIELLFMTLSQARSSQAGSSPQHHSNGGHTEDTLAWCHTAAEQGLPTAQRALARIYADGKLVAKDLVTAYMWYLMAERTSLELSTHASTDKKQLAPLLTRDQIQMAERRAQDQQFLSNNQARPVKARTAIAKLNKGLVQVLASIVA